MSVATLSEPFQTARFNMADFIARWNQQIMEWRPSAQESPRDWYSHLKTTWENWPQIKQDFLTSLAEMPRELKKRDFVVKLVQEAENFDRNIRESLTSMGEALPNLSQNLLEWKQNLQLTSTRYSAAFHQLAEHPLTQKFLKGEVILASRSKIQWLRKLGHMFFGVAFLYLFRFSGIPQNILHWTAGLFATACVGLETARHFHPRINAWVCKAFRPVMREREKAKINSAIYYIVAMLLVYNIFPMDVSLLAMLFIAIGDPIAGIVGVYFGKTRLTSHASLEGFLGCFLTCSLLSVAAAKWIFLSHSITGMNLFFFSTLAGLAGALAETSFKKIDDNFVMPILSAPAIYGLLRLFS